MDPDQAAVGQRVDDARSAARSLSARNAVSFDCVQGLEESRAKLAAITIARAFLPKRGTQREAYEMPMAPQPTLLDGKVTGESVDLAWGLARFRGRWTREGSGIRLEGHVERSQRVPLAVAAFALPVVSTTVVAFKSATASAWQAPGIYFFFLPAAILAIGMPLLVMGLGSARVAAEIELVRAIGLAIGDPEKYTIRWRRIRDD